MLEYFIRRAGAGNGKQAAIAVAEIRVRKEYRVVDKHGYIKIATIEEYIRNISTE